LKELHERWGDWAQFVDVVIRQAHPGPKVRPYRTFEEKLQDAGRYVREESIPWTVAVDDLEGRVHQVYGGVADPTYLIDADGRVAFYNMWTHAPTLHQALGALLAQGGRGVVTDGIDSFPHMAPALADGWRGLERGLPQSYIDMETAAPGAATALWVGHQLKPVLGPLALRATPLPKRAKLGLGLGLLAVGMLAGALLRRRSGSA
jgi:hypothetical protein